MARVDFCVAGNCSSVYNHWVRRCVHDDNCTAPALCGDDNQCHLEKLLQGWEGSAAVICGAATVLAVALIMSLPVKLTRA